MTLVKRPLFDPTLFAWRVHGDRVIPERGILFCKYRANDWKSTKQSHGPDDLSRPVGGTMYHPWNIGPNRTEFPSFA